MKIPKTLELLPGEARVFSFNFEKQKEIIAGQTIQSAVVVLDPPNAAITISQPPVIVGALVKNTYSATDVVKGEFFQVFCDATTSGGAIMGMVGNLAIVDPDSLEDTGT